MTPESILLRFAPTVIKELLNLARQKRDDKLRKIIQEEFSKIPFSSSFNSITVVTIHIGDVVQEIHRLADSDRAPDAIMKKKPSSTLPPFLSANEMVSGFDTATRNRLGSSTSLVEDATPSKRRTVGLYQRFAGGRDDPVKASVYKSHYGAYPIWGAIARCHERHGGTGGRLGFPTSFEFDATTSPQKTRGRGQRFEGCPDDPGETAISIYWSSHGAYPIWGAIARYYERHGGTGGRLGFPISREYWVDGSPRQEFEGGVISGSDL